MKRWMKYGLVSFLSIATLSACKKPEDKVEDFDRAPMLVNYADNLIIPNYSDLNAKVNELKTATQDFTQSPDVAKLNTLKDKWFATYLQWEHCKMFDFGPALDETLMRKLNTYPVDTVKIEENITSGTYNFELIDQTQTQGLAVLDYMLYHKSDQEVIGEMDANRKAYLNAVVDRMQTAITTVSNAWSSYRATFINSTGTDASSSTSYLVNEMNKDFERIKSVKFKFPLGGHVLNIPQPELLECKYSKKSFELAQANTIAIENVYNGDSRIGQTGLGFDDYLVHLGENTTTIKDNTLADFTDILNYYNNYSSHFATEMDADYNKVYTHYEKYQDMVYHLKSELPSAISILITYQDNDGD